MSLVTDSTSTFLSQTTYALIEAITEYTKVRTSPLVRSLSFSVLVESRGVWVPGYHPHPLLSIDLLTQQVANSGS